MTPKREGPEHKSVLAITRIFPHPPSVACMPSTFLQDHRPAVQPAQPGASDAGRCELRPADGNVPQLGRPRRARRKRSLERILQLHVPSPQPQQLDHRKQVSLATRAICTPTAHCPQCCRNHHGHVRPCIFSLLTMHATIPLCAAT
jgi:hypothetical protein